jgi:predicted AAA+ superfamily ATPase
MIVIFNNSAIIISNIDIAERIWEMYIKRTLENAISQQSQHYPVVLVTGARQVGKTSMLKNISEANRVYVNFDDIDLVATANNDPKYFFEKYLPPVLLDEVQYVPDLFRQIKQVSDASALNNLFWITGSQQFDLMKNVTESLAGRIAIFRLYAMSTREMQCSANTLKPFTPNRNHFQYLEESSKKSNRKRLFEIIHRGSFPFLSTNKNADRDLFYKSYIQTYLERDIRSLTQVADLVLFQNFIRAVAARTGQVLIYADLANDVGISQPTAKRWISILETSGLVYLLRPYFNNRNKQVVKAPKIYFLDTGLCSYLTRWSDPETLEAGAMSGPIFETYVVGEILKSFAHNGQEIPLYYFRDKHQNEIDLLLEINGQLFPIEIKKTSTPSRSVKLIQRNRNALDALGQKVGPMTLICMTDSITEISPEITAIGAWTL